MKQIEIFDPALCCSTGVCGPSVDSKLVQAAADVEALKKQGVFVKRYNLSQDLDAFAGNATVKSLLAAHGTDILPITLVDGKVCKERDYPVMSEFREWLESEKLPASVQRSSFRSIEIKPNQGSCCGNDSTCC
ncbi:arsenite efflux transporter metallochaperone ArsD [Paenibacillus timonensis]|uniref:Arsenite efflux transporter metallochaperone ArsD n=1 Tax=Paenibacillus timonensis TaxID=225915 RepID=A0ABW3S871_9BACL|nr:arsenite efflux transporter metallochaperone ArsD [Paenibacillus timonensis]MCH1638906.1 arsenite efflux transporter metallochaperone ArsD [Paenibacillus timonensis]